MDRISKKRCRVRLASVLSALSLAIFPLGPTQDAHAQNTETAVEPQALATASGFYQFIDISDVPTDAISIEVTQAASGAYRIEGDAWVLYDDSFNRGRFQINAQPDLSGTTPSLKIGEYEAKFVNATDPRNPEPRLGIRYRDRVFFPAPPPRSIMDYFLQCPLRLSGVSVDRRINMLFGRMDDGFTLDVKNGYVAYRASDNPEAWQMALFRGEKGPSQTDLLAISSVLDLELIEPNANVTPLTFVTFKDGRWSDVTAEYAPEPIDPKLKYVLPREGLVIRVQTQTDKTLRTWTWNRSRFVVGKP